MTTLNHQPGDEAKAEEYLRRRRVWRYANNCPGPQEAPSPGDEVWLGEYVYPEPALDPPLEEDF